MYPTFHGFDFVFDYAIDGGDPAFRKQAVLEKAFEAAEARQERVYEFVVSVRGDSRRSGWLFLAKDEDELRARMAVVSIMSR